MKNLNFLRTSGVLMVALVMATFLFMSTNTTDKSNDQTIAELSKEVAALKAIAKENKSDFGETDYAYIGEIQMFAGNFAPRYWAFCDGQLLPISEYEALFSVIGTTYGGDGRSTFALPDLRGRVPVHVGNGSGPGLSNVKLGEKGGLESTEVGNIQVSKDGGNNADVVNRVGKDNRQPYLGVNYIIALRGQYPPRS